MRKPSLSDKTKVTPAKKGFSSKKWLPWLLAVLIALLLWVQSLKGRTFQISVTLPVATPEILTPDEDEYVLYIDSDTDSVTITFAGVGAGIIRDQITHHPSFVSWQETVSASDNAFPLSKIHILTTQDIVYSTENYSLLEPVIFLPHSISYEIDRRIDMLLPVHITSADSIPGRFFWSSSSNDSVLVGGAADVIMELSYLSTEAIAPGNPLVATEFSEHRGIESCIPKKIFVALRHPEPVVLIPGF